MSSFVDSLRFLDVWNLPSLVLCGAFFVNAGMKELQLISWGSASVAPHVLMAIQGEVIRRMDRMERNRDFEMDVKDAKEADCASSIVYENI